MRKYLVPFAAFAIVIIAMAWQSRSSEPVFCEASDFRLANVDGCRVLPDPSDELPPELAVLPADTIVERRIYEDAAGRPYSVTLVIGGRSKSSIHRPELCLPSQGFQMASPREIEVRSRPWHLISLARKAESPALFAYTFFNQDGCRTASHIRRIFRDVWDRSIRGRIDRWAMITVLSPVHDDLAFAGFLSALERSMR